MAQFSLIWATSDTPTGDQVTDYTQAHAADMFKILAGASAPEGVIPNMGNSNPTDLQELVASVPGLNTVRIGTGRAVVDGRGYYNSSPVDINIPSAAGAGNTRIERIVLRAGSAAYDVAIAKALIAAVDGAPPSPPALTQNPGVNYELPLWQVTVDTAGNVSITLDERVWSAPTRLADGAVATTAKLADNIVTSAKVGTEVPQFLRRQGGSAGDWNVAGSTGMTPGMVRMQTGTREFTPASNPDSGTISVTFPLAFSAKPQIFFGRENPNPFPVQIGAVSVTTTGFMISWIASSVSAAGTEKVHWMALGPE